MNGVLLLYNFLVYIKVLFLSQLYCCYFIYLTNSNF